MIATQARCWGGRRGRGGRSKGAGGAGATARAILALAAVSLSGCGSWGTEGPGRRAIFNGRDLSGWRVLREDDFSEPGRVEVREGCLVLGAGDPQTGVSWTGAFPRDRYEVMFSAQRLAGGDFFCGMTFPVGPDYCTLIMGGFGGSVLGLSNIDDAAADRNETTQMIDFQQDRWYGVRLRVADGRIQVWLDGERVIDVAREGRKFSIWPQQEPVRPFGIATWRTTGRIADLVLTRLAPAP